MIGLDQADERQEAFLRAFANVFDLSLDLLTLDARLDEDLGVDSLGYVEIGALCAEYGIRLEESDVERLVCIRDVLDVIGLVGGSSNV